MILFAVFLRLLGDPATGNAVTAHTGQIASALIFLQTGRVVKEADLVQNEPTPTEHSATEPSATAPAPAVVPIFFAAADAALVKLHNQTDKRPDVEGLLQQPLSWDLTADEPTVLILHTHATESYENTEGYTASGDYRTLDPACNMVSIGQRVSQLLKDAGINTLHIDTLHDYPSYNGSYKNARKTLQHYLEQHPSIRLVLDLHRDAATDNAGNQIGHSISTENGKAAKVMLVVGCNHSSWKENAALAFKVHARLEQLCPGICRPAVLRASRFNQDLLEGALLIEVGAAGNTRQEALLSAEYIAQAIIDLANGANETAHPVG